MKQYKTKDSTYVYTSSYKAKQCECSILGWIELYFALQIKMLDKGRDSDFESTENPGLSV